MAPSTLRIMRSQNSSRVPSFPPGALPWGCRDGRCPPNLLTDFFLSRHRYWRHFFIFGVCEKVAFQFIRTDGNRRRFAFRIEYNLYSLYSIEFIPAVRVEL